MPSWIELPLEFLNNRFFFSCLRNMNRSTEELVVFVVRGTSIEDDDVVDLICKHFPTIPSSSRGL